MSEKSQKSISKLVIKAQQGDGEAFEELYQYYYNSIYFFSLKLARNDADARDIVQDTFLQVHKSISSLIDPASFKIWLNRIAFSKATRLFSRNRTFSFDPSDSPLLDHEVEERMYMNPLKQYRFDNDKDILDNFIALLPLEQQAVLILMYYDQYTMVEIAEICDIPLGTVKSRLYSAKLKLRDLVKEYEHKTKVALDFKGEALGATLITMYARQHATTLGLGIPGKKKWYAKMSTVLGAEGIKAALFACSFIVVAGSGYGIYQDIIADKEDPVNFSNPSQSLMDDEKEFGPITYQGTSFERSDRTYYELLRFAHCEKEMKLKSKEEFEAIKPLYEAIKTYGGYYYEQLNNDDWIQSIEQYIY